MWLGGSVRVKLSGSARVALLYEQVRSRATSKRHKLRPRGNTAWKKVKVANRIALWLTYLPGS